MAVGQSQSGTGWEMYTDENVLVVEFSDSDAFEEVEAINETFFEMMATEGVDAHVACIQMDRAAGDKMLEGAQEAARKGRDHGLRRWGIADDGIGKLAIKNKVDLPEIEVEGFDSKQSAVEWAKGQ